MKKTYLFTAVVAALLFAGCSKDQTVGTGNMDGKIVFRAISDKQTRATETNATNFADFAVYAYMDANAGATVSAALSPGFFYGETVTKGDDSKWTYVNTKFWPETGTLHFFGYSPSTSQSTFAPASGTAGLPTLSYTVAATVAAQEDLIYAQAQGQQKPSSATDVTMTFKHALAQLIFEAKSGLSGITFDISNIEVLNMIGSGTLSLSEYGTATIDGVSVNVPKWSLGTSPLVNYTASLGASATEIGTSSFVNLTGTGGTLMVMPQTLTAGDGSNTSVGSHLKITYTAKQGGTTVVEDAVALVPFGLTMHGGYRYVIQLTLNGTGELFPITFDAFVGDWVDDPSNPHSL